MDIFRRRSSAPKMSILAGVLLLLVLIALVTETHTARGSKHKRKRHSVSGHRRAVTMPRYVMSPRRRHHRNDRSVYLNDAANITLCAYRVFHDKVVGRIPELIHHVKCVEHGCRCKVVNDTGTYACTQLVTNVSVILNNERREIRDVPYACVCASQLGVEVSGPSPPPLVD